MAPPREAWMEFEMLGALILNPLDNGGSQQLVAVFKSPVCWFMNISRRDWTAQSGWWFGTFGLFSISYVGCHPNPIDELICLKMVIAPPTSFIYWDCHSRTVNQPVIWLKNHNFWVLLRCSDLSTSSFMIWPGVFGVCESGSRIHTQHITQVWFHEDWNVPTFAKSCPPLNVHLRARLKASEFAAKYVQGCKVVHRHNHACTHIHTYVLNVYVFIVCSHQLLEREHKLRTRAELDCSQDLLFIFQPFFYMVRPWKTALTQQVDYSISAYSTRQQGRKVIYHGFSFSTLKGVTIRPKMTGHQSLWSWHGLNKSKHRSLTDWPVIFTLKPIVWVWNLMFVVSTSSYWCLVGNGWEWGNGMIITSDGGSFPYSLLSTSKSF